jgi:hypothetical protein
MLKKVIIAVGGSAVLLALGSAAFVVSRRKA